MENGALTGTAVDDLEYKPIGFSGQPWPQYKPEVAGLIDVLRSEGARSYLEIGCRYGDTFHAVGMSLPEGSRLVAVDLPGARNSKRTRTTHSHSGRYLERAARALITSGRPATVIFGDSHSKQIRSQTRDLGPFDAILVDGDHSPEGALADWNDYGPMGRIVAFHDVMMEGRKSASRGPGPLYERLALTHRHKLISVDRHCRGFGIIWRD
jgi:predicted O-methyltransferase YrrM